MYGWSSDDQVLTGIYRPGNTTALGFLSLSTGELRVLKSFDWRDAHAVLSSDGGFIAYDHPPGPDPSDREIFLMSSDGSNETVLVEGPGRDVVLGLVAWGPRPALSQRALWNTVGLASLDG
jgi:Tol biopolymer transport system component